MKSKSLLVLLAIAGCSTVPIAPPHVLGPSVVVVRDSGFSGSGCTMVVLIDGKRNGTVDAGESLATPVSSGSHRVTIGQGKYADSVICPDLTMTLQVEVADKQVDLRVGIGSNRQLFFEQID